MTVGTGTSVLVGFGSVVGAGAGVGVTFGGTVAGTVTETVGGKAGVSFGGAAIVAGASFIGGAVVVGARAICRMRSTFSSSLDTMVSAGIRVELVLVVVPHAAAIKARRAAPAIERREVEAVASARCLWFVMSVQRRAGC